MFIILSSSQELLDVLGDLLRFADDVLRAGKRGVRLCLQIIQLRDGAALSKPSAAPQPPPSPNARIIHLRVIECVVIVTFWDAALLFQL